MAGATIAQVVTVHTGDHHVAELERGDRPGQVLGLVHVQRVGPAMADVAERAAPRALVAHDHERGRALAEAFADVGATGLFAHRHQLVGAQHILDFIEARGRAAGLDPDPVGFLEDVARLDLDRDARQLRAGFLLGGCIVGFCGLCVAYNVFRVHRFRFLIGGMPRGATMGRRSRDGDNPRFRGRGRWRASDPATGQPRTTRPRGRL